MKKTLLMLAFTVMAATVFVSCQKEDASNEQKQPTNVEFELSDDDGMGLRADPYTIAYNAAAAIVSDSLDCSFIYDIDDMYCLGSFFSSYIFCVPTDYISGYYLILFPSLSSAFVIHDVQGLPNFHYQTNTPPVYYNYEIYDACIDNLICKGRVYAQSGYSAFTVTDVVFDLTYLGSIEYNLLNMFNLLAVGTYTYQGIIQGQHSNLTRDEYLYSIAKECYNHFYN